MTIWFTADTHFGHTNILKYENRLYKHIQDHDRDLIERWNSRVKPKESVYHLGDFGLASPAYLAGVLARLNGNVHLIRGNHDRFVKNKLIRDKFGWVKEYYELKHDKQKIVLFHYPIHSWNGKNHGVWHLHGHTHGNTHHGKSPGIDGLRVEVGVDLNDYYPVSFEELKELIEKWT